ncbi:MAG: VRR-NUC domain-containing protein [Lactococcus lactis]
MKDFLTIKRKRRKNIELSLQQSFFKWLSLQHPTLEPFCFHIANEGKRSEIGGYQLKLAGLKKGICDVFCSFPSTDGFKILCGLYIEFKSKGNKPTKEQLNFIDLVNRNGYCAVWVDNLDDAMYEFNLYVKNRSCMEAVCRSF